MSHQLLGRQQRHRKERFKSKHEAAEKRQASTAIYQHQLEQHAIATQQALAAGLPAPPAPEAPKSKRRQHHTKDGSLRNHRVKVRRCRAVEGTKRPPRGGGRGGQQAGSGTSERKDGEDSEEEDEDEDGQEGNTGRAKKADDERDDDDPSDYTSSSSSDDEAPPEAAVYSFVPPRTTTSQTQHATKPAPGTNKPVLPPSLREQSLLVVKQQSTQQRDELDELLHMDDGKGGRTEMNVLASVTSDRGQKAKGGADLRNLEDELDDLLKL